MTMKKKPKEKKPSGMAISGMDVAIEKDAVDVDSSKLMTKDDLKRITAEIGEEKGTLREIAKELLSQTGHRVTQPTISNYLDDIWGKDAKKKKENMRERHANMNRWNRDFDNARANVGNVFHKHYVSSNDGMFYDREKDTLVHIPQMNDTERKYKKKDIIKFVTEKRFGYSPNPTDMNKSGTYDPSILAIVKIQLRSRIYGISEDKYKRLYKQTFEDEMELKDTSGMNLDQIIALEKEVKKRVRKDLVPKRKEFSEEAKKTYEMRIKQLKEDGVDPRSAALLGKDLLDKRLCPAFASSSKKFRGRQRMLALEGTNKETGEPYMFSRVVYNIPFLLWNHPKRLQIMSHNMAKNLPELLEGEKPVVKGKFDDIVGRNVRIRMPKSAKEDILTREAGIIITEGMAKKFRYFNTVESGNIVAESIEELPKTWRMNKPGKNMPIKSYADYKVRVGEALDVKRGDPLTFGGFTELDGSPGYKEAKHSGRLIYIGAPKQKKRTLTADPDRTESGKSKLEVDYWVQEYQIVREDDLKIGDKIISRNGLKGVIADVVKDLGKDKKGRVYDGVVNEDEVWREADPKSPDYKIEEETFFKQGKKKSGVVREHEAGDGQIFFFLIDKMSQDQSTSGLRMSTTMLAGLWEWFITDLMEGGKKYTQQDLDSRLQSFVERYFGDEGTFVPSLKAMHYKAVKKGDRVSIEIDEKEPVEDEAGKIEDLPHTYAGRTYKHAYIPNYVSRVYFDGTLLREYYQISTKDKGKVTSASDFSWAFIVKQLKNKLYLFPRNEDAVNLVAVPNYDKKPENYDVVTMDAIDFINAGGNPYDKKPMITLRKEPVTDKLSIQTHPVKIDWSGKYAGCIGIHPSVAVKATIDYDGDQVVVFTPPIEIARVHLDTEEIAELKSLNKKKYKSGFKDFYKKAEDVKYAKDEIALGVDSAEYNQTTAETENTMIQQLGGLRKRALLFYGSELPDPIKFGSDKDPREKQLTPTLVNAVCDVEKILKMREPRWVVKALQKRDWDSLTAAEKDLVQDYHIRRELNRRLQRLIDNENLHRLKEVVSNEKTFIEDDKIIDRGVDPINLEIEIGRRLIDRVIWQQIKNRPDILEEEL